MRLYVVRGSEDKAVKFIDFLFFKRQVAIETGGRIYCAYTMARWYYQQKGFTDSKTSKVLI